MPCNFTQHLSAEFAHMPDIGISFLAQFGLHMSSLHPGTIISNDDV